MNSSWLNIPSKAKTSFLISFGQWQTKWYKQVVTLNQKVLGTKTRKASQSGQSVCFHCHTRELLWNKTKFTRSGYSYNCHRISCFGKQLLHLFVKDSRVDGHRSLNAIQLNAATELNVRLHGKSSLSNLLLFPVSSKLFTPIDKQSEIWMKFPGEYQNHHHLWSVCFWSQFIVYFTASGSSWASCPTSLDYHLPSWQVFFISNNLHCKTKLWVSPAANCHKQFQNGASENLRFRLCFTETIESSLVVMFRRAEVVILFLRPERM